MKKTKLNLMAAAMFVLAAFTSCEDEIPKTPSEVQKEAIIAALPQDKEALKQIEINSVNKKTRCNGQM